MNVTDYIKFAVKEIFVCISSFKPTLVTSHHLTMATANFDRYMTLLSIGNSPVHARSKQIKFKNTNLNSQNTFTFSKCGFLITSHGLT